MSVRLGFAVSTALEPDLLLIDEVLAVGDANFRGKCYNKLDSLRSRTATIFVSHNMEQIGRVCDRTLVLEGGKVHFHGDTGGGMGAYRQLCTVKHEGFVNSFAPCLECRFHQKQLEINHGDPLDIEISLLSAAAIEVWPRFLIFNETAQVVAEGNSEVNNQAKLSILAGENRFVLQLGSIHLQGGEYSWSLNLHGSNGMLVHGHMCGSFLLRASNRGETGYQLPFTVKGVDYPV